MWPFCFLRTVFSTWVDFTSRGTVYKVWRHFRLSRLLGVGEECCCHMWVEISRPADRPALHRTAPCHTVIWPQMSIVPQLRYPFKKETVTTALSIWSVSLWQYFLIVYTNIWTILLTFSKNCLLAVVILYIMFVFFVISILEYSPTSLGFILHYFQAS